MLSVKRIVDLQVNAEDMSISEKIEPDLVKIIILDGQKGTAKVFNAVQHGETIIETHNGKTKRVRFEDGELL